MMKPACAVGNAYVAHYSYSRQEAIENTTKILDKYEDFAVERLGLPKLQDEVHIWDQIQGRVLDPAKDKDPFADRDVKILSKPAGIVT